MAPYDDDHLTLEQKMLAKLDRIEGKLNQAIEGLDRAAAILETLLEAREEDI